MIGAAALVLLCGECLGVADLAALGASDDARAIPHLEAVLGQRLEDRKRFPDSLAPTEIDDEIGAALVSLERLDPERGAFWARATLPAVSHGDLSWVAREVLARFGDLGVIRDGLRDYFVAPERWRRVLGGAAASGDVRLRDFVDFGTAPAVVSEKLFRTRLAYALGERMELPREGGFDDLLAGEPHDVHRRVLALSAEERYRATRVLAERDHEALIGLPMASVSIDHLFPYLARSRFRALRDRVHRTRAERGRALASLLLSPAAPLPEKRAHAAAMEDAWLDAIVSVRRDLVTPIVGEAEMVRHIRDSEPSPALIYIDRPEARERLERSATANAVRWLGSRSDTVLALPRLVALRAATETDVRLAAEMELLRVAAPGATPFLWGAIRGPHLTSLVPAALEAPLDPSLVQRAVEELGRREEHGPDAFAAMSQFHARYPDAFLSWVSAGERTLRERAQLVMALSGDERRLPLWIELAATGEGASREAAFLALAEARLGSFDKRLHRLAGDPDRGVRFHAAAALVPTGEEWAVRLLVAELDTARTIERRRARRAIGRLPNRRARRLLEAMISDGTATPFAVTLYLDRVDADDLDRESIWEILEEPIGADDPWALIAAARLDHPQAIAAVERFLADR